MSTGTLGSRLREARKAASLTQQDLAVRAGLVVRSVAGYEAEEKMPSADVIVRLCGALSISSDQLLGIDTHAPTVAPAAVGGE